MAEEAEESAVVARLDEVLTLLRSVDRRLQELTEAQQRGRPFGPLGGTEPDLGMPHGGVGGGDFADPRLGPLDVPGKASEHPRRAR